MFTSISLNWTYSGKDAQEFEIIYGFKVKGEVLTNTITTKKTQYVLGNLQENTSYKICISAVNLAGSGSKQCKDSKTCKCDNQLKKVFILCVPYHYIIFILKFYCYCTIILSGKPIMAQ